MSDAVTRYVVPDGVNPESWVPTEDVGPIEANLHCRAYRRHGDAVYCTRASGFGTTHIGEGRCFQHGGLPSAPNAVPSEIRQRLRNGAVARIQTLENIADDAAAKSAERIRAIDVLLRYGIGTADQLTVVSADVLARLEAQAQRFVAELSPEALATVRRICDEVWQ